MIYYLDVTPIIFNTPTSKRTRRGLRKIVPEPEKRLWYHLRNRRLNGYKFRRQYAAGRYVVDFYCPTAKLALEIDGDSHFTDTAQTYDKQRETFLKANGVRILRFTNSDVMKNLESVLEKIAHILTSP